MNGVDPRLVRALRTQLQARRGERVGWKLGVGDAERLGGTLSVGHLTTTTLLEPGATYDAAGARLHADAEIAVLIGDGYAAAIELVDLANAGDSAAAVVATNIFHRAVAFGQPQPVLPARLEGRLLVNGTLRAAGQAPRDVAARIGAAAEILAAVGERLETGDRVITGSVVQVPVQAGDEVTADFGLLGSVTVKLS